MEEVSNEETGHEIVLNNDINMRPIGGSKIKRMSYTIESKLKIIGEYKQNQSVRSTATNNKITRRMVQRHL